MQIGQRIRELREKRGLSQCDVERTTGMLREYLSRVEHGHTAPSLESIERFSAVLCVPIHEMFRNVSAHSGEPVDAKNERPFWAPLSGYVRKLDADDRQVLMRLAQRLSERDR